MNSPPPEQDLLTAARNRVSIGPVPEWVSASAYDPRFTPAVAGKYTYLLTERQTHSEHRQSFERNAVRLETIQAVQEASQWRLDFDPQTQAVVLHSITVRRGAETFNHLSADHFQFLRRESGLEGLSILHGWITLLLVLEDVRPGDILETSFTIQSFPRIFEQLSTAFFTLPAGCQIGKYHLSIQYSPARGMKWKSSSPDLTPSVLQHRDETRMVWTAEAKNFSEIEEAIPWGCLPFPWIQVSDCPDWQTVASGILKAWNETPVGDEFTQLLAEIEGSGGELSSRVNRAIELVQDGFRYLSVNVELGGQVPSPAEAVVRRRYGDCKDLAFLLVRILRAMGLAARPVLVHGHWRAAVADLLPSPGAFNHALVEFEVHNEKRWVDCTMRSQGGGALGRWVHDFGVGLPIDAATRELAPVPKSSLPSGSCEIKESLILDTAGNPSHLAVTLVLTGFYADDLRFQFATEGPGTVAKNRLQNCADRYGKATRVGHLEYHDDRAANEFVLAEVFDVEGFLLKEANTSMCVFRLPNDAIRGFLFRPSGSLRRNPFALPYPCNRVHIIEIDFQALEAIQIPLFQVRSDFFRFSRRSKGLRKFFRITFSFETLREAVPPASLDKHRKEVDEVWRAAALQLRLPSGYSRLRKRSTFGALPATRSQAASNVATPILPASVSEPEPIALREPVNASIEELGGDPSTPAPQEKKIFVRPSAPRILHAGRSRPATRRSPHRRGMGTGGLAFGIFISSLVLLLVAALIYRSPFGVALSNLLFLFVIVGVVGSVVVSIAALRVNARHSGSSGSDKGLAWVTAAFGSIIGLFLLMALIGGSRSMLKAEAHDRRARSDQPDWLKLEDYKFRFRSPESPWMQVDAHRLGQQTVLAFRRPGIQFTIFAHALEPGFVDAQARVIELNKVFINHELSAVHFLSERQVSRNDLAGWEMEFTGNVQGHDLYAVNWILAENGFGYVLSTVGLPDNKSEIRSAAEQMCSSFQCK